MESAITLSVERLITFTGLRSRDTEIRRVTAGTDPETIRAHVNRINRWHTASEHQYPGLYRAFLHEWCRYPRSGDSGLASAKGSFRVRALSCRGSSIGSDNRG